MHNWPIFLVFWLSTYQNRFRFIHYRACRIKLVSLQSRLDRAKYLHPVKKLMKATLYVRANIWFSVSIFCSSVPSNVSISIPPFNAAELRRTLHSGRFQLDMFRIWYPSNLPNLMYTEQTLSTQYACKARRLDHPHHPTPASYCPHPFTLEWYWFSHFKSSAWLQSIEYQFEASLFEWIVWFNSTAGPLDLHCFHSEHPAHY